MDIVANCHLYVKEGREEGRKSILFSLSLPSFSFLLSLNMYFFSLFLSPPFPPLSFSFSRRPDSGAAAARVIGTKVQAACLPAFEKKLKTQTPEN